MLLRASPRASTRRSSTTKPSRQALATSAPGYRPPPRPPLRTRPPALAAATGRTSGRTSPSSASLGAAPSRRAGCRRARRGWRCEEDTRGESATPPSPGSPAARSPCGCPGQRSRRRCRCRASRRRGPWRTVSSPAWAERSPRSSGLRATHPPSLSAVCVSRLPLPWLEPPLYTTTGVGRGFAHRPRPDDSSTSVRWCAIIVRIGSTCRALHCTRGADREL
mmetsp:Transcript_11080/g.36689  ORF Transcript_11080/g.36689 Transcript_11080/m.36689 type:complete len:221 (-) Transcript_11080:218-880(-)